MNATLVKRSEITAKAWIVNLVAIPVSVIVTGVTVVGALSLPNKVSISNLELVWFLAGLMGLCTAHELIHALTLKFFDRLPWTAFKFGISWRQLVLYCHCRQPVSIRTFRRCALGPLVLLGSLTILATIAYPAVWLAFATGIHLSGCIGDVWMYVRSLQFPEQFFFQDFPDRIGGAVFEPVPELVPSGGQTEIVTQ